jgi:hypothetical protein
VAWKQSRGKSICNKQHIDIAAYRYSSCNKQHIDLASATEESRKQHRLVKKRTHVSADVSSRMLTYAVVAQAACNSSSRPSSSRAHLLSGFASGVEEEARKEHLRQATPCPATARLWPATSRVCPADSPIREHKAKTKTRALSHSESPSIALLRASPPAPAARYSVSLLYWYKSTNTDAAAG